MRIKDIARSVLAEVGEPPGSPEDPFQGGVDLDTVPGGEPGTGQDQVGAAPAPAQAAQSAPMDDAPEKDVDTALVSMAQRHKYVTDHDHPEDDDPMRYLTMDKDSIEDAIDETKQRVARINIDKDRRVGASYDDDEYMMLSDKLSFLKELLRRM